MLNSNLAYNSKEYSWNLPEWSGQRLHIYAFMKQKFKDFKNIVHIHLMMIQIFLTGWHLFQLSKVAINKIEVPNIDWVFRYIPLNVW